MRFSEFKEAKSHGTTDFPVEYYDVKEGAPNSIMPLHWHEELELVRVSRGKLDLYINNEETVLGAGELAFIGSGMLHRAEPHCCDYECLVFSVSLRILSIDKYIRSKLSQYSTIYVSAQGKNAKKWRIWRWVFVFNCHRIEYKYIESGLMYVNV